MCNCIDTSIHTTQACSKAGLGLDPFLLEYEFNLFELSQTFLYININTTHYFINFDGIQ